MHPGFEIPGILHQETGENTGAPVLLSMNQSHILDQIHTLPTTQQLFLGQHHFLPPQSRLNNQYGAAAAGVSSAYFPVNFKLGLNEICTRNNYKDGEDALLRGSEQYEIAETRHSSLGMLHGWQNQEDSALKQQPFWEPLPAEVSNEKSEIVDRQEHLEMNRKEAPTTCLESKSRVQFGELEAIYKRLSTAESNQTGPSHESNLPMNVHLPMGFDHGSEASIGEDQALKNDRKKRKKKKKETRFNIAMAEFFGNLVNQVMDHQENLHKKFAEVIERLDDERKARDEAWRNQELAYFEQEAAARAREKAETEAREAMIISYLEKIAGQRVNFPIN
ncbi:hypothetical protein CDL12_18199 [Handroanthus impetiginosus]|uniref:Uncharacterized protein n=1 Tax=Handroanthus impetiginosus TaxID=429701 RepID=A0A2G9GVD8_9LAMI|nr:hypothetical protein CDL12_18199 [Handroanthus impetiginosus]